VISDSEIVVGIQGRKMDLNEKQFFHG